MVYIRSFTYFLSLCRVVLLSFTIFLMVQGVLEIPVPQLPLFINLTLGFALLHGIGDTANPYIFRNSQFTYTSIIVIIWALFINLSGLIPFITDNSYGVQSLFSSISLCVVGLYVYQDLRRTFHVFSHIKLDSRVIIVISFLVVIFFGAALLLLPVSRGVSGKIISPVDAFFTAASAVCVTGLTVVNTALDFSLFGQIVILLLIQVGALGLVTITAVLINLLGRSLSMQGQLSAKNSFSSRLGDNSLQKFLRFALFFTLGAEILLSLSFFTYYAPNFLSQVPDVYSSPPSALAHAVYYSVFHAISAFCNAGFSLYSDSLMGFRTNPLFNGTVIIAILVGGLGFLVWQDMFNYMQGRAVRLRLQSLIALRMSFFLVISVTFIYWLVERPFSLQGLDLWDQIVSSLFVSVNLRTAGFNTTDMGATGEAARFISCITMYIGASPGSTGGGLKTTTFAIILGSIRQISNNEQSVIIAGRKVNKEFISQAWFLMINSLIWISGVIFILSLVERLPLSAVMYEVFSAYSTVGVSVGITPNLSSFSKILLSITMIIGRVGASTLIFAFMGKARHKLSIAPEEDLAVG